MSKTHTRADLIDAVYTEVGLSRQECGDLVESVLETIATRLETSDCVKISAFGTFQTRNKKERMGRNPKTGEEVAITPRRVLTFKASQVMKDRINASMRAKSTS